MVNHPVINHLSIVKCQELSFKKANFTYKISIPYPQQLQESFLVSFLISCCFVHALAFVSCVFSWPSPSERTDAVRRRTSLGMFRVMRIRIGCLLVVLFSRRYVNPIFGKVLQPRRRKVIVRVCHERRDAFYTAMAPFLFLAKSIWIPGERESWLINPRSFRDEYILCSYIAVWL